MKGFPVTSGMPPSTRGPRQPAAIMPRKNARKARAYAHQIRAAAPRQRLPVALHAQRQRLAYEAARIMSDEQIDEFEHARRKAAERMGVTNRRLWPDNEEIQQRLLEQQRLFGGASRRRERLALLEQGLAAMQLFENFSPRLVGPAWAGTASAQQGLDLHLFSDNAEEVIWTLIDLKIPWEADQGQFRYSDNTAKEHPILSFVAGTLPVRIAVLPAKARQHPPLDAVSNRPERGANRAQLEQEILQARENPDWPREDEATARPFG
jgi:hypothetical protein